jgi:hypothetical protein
MLIGDTGGLRRGFTLAMSRCTALSPRYFTGPTDDRIDRHDRTAQHRLLKYS